MKLSIRFLLAAFYLLNLNLNAKMSATNLEMKLLAGANPTVSAEAVWGDLNLEELFECIGAARSQGQSKVAERIKNLILDHILNQDIATLMPMFEGARLKELQRYVAENFDLRLDRAQEAREFLAERISSAQTIDDVLW